MKAKHSWLIPRKLTFLHKTSELLTVFPWRLLFLLLSQVLSFSLASTHFQHFWKAEFAGMLSVCCQELKALGLLWSFKELSDWFNCIAFETYCCNVDMCKFKWRKAPSYENRSWQVDFSKSQSKPYRLELLVILYRENSRKFSFPEMFEMC